MLGRTSVCLSCRQLQTLFAPCGVSTEDISGELRHLFERPEPRAMNGNLSEKSGPPIKGASACLLQPATWRAWAWLLATYIRNAPQSERNCASTYPPPAEGALLRAILDRITKRCGACLPAAAAIVRRFSTGLVSGSLRDAGSKIMPNEPRPSPS